MNLSHSLYIYICIYLSLYIYIYILPLLGKFTSRDFDISLHSFCADSSSGQIVAILVGHVTREHVSLRESPQSFRNRRTDKCRNPGREIPQPLQLTVLGHWIGTGKNLPRGEIPAGEREPPEFLDSGGSYALARLCLSVFFPWGRIGRSH